MPRDEGTLDCPGELPALPPIFPGRGPGIPGRSGRAGPPPGDGPAAQADRPPVPKHQDPVVQGVQDHIDRLCEAHDARLAEIDDVERLKRELAQCAERFLNLLGLDLDTPRQPPTITTAGVLEFPEYRIEKLVIESAPGVFVPCNVYVPRSGPPRKPALICPHGHSGRDGPSIRTPTSGSRRPGSSSWQRTAGGSRSADAQGTARPAVNSPCRARS